jgi:penicillin-binding protein 2
LVTPLQATNMMAVFANGGYLVNPYIVKSIGGLDFSAKKKKLTAVNFKKNTFEIISKGMRRAVADKNGTANALSTLSVTVAGKTGTAQVSRGANHGWFVGFFPFDKPKFVICVFLENGGSGHAASLVTKQIIETMSEQGLM